jgi:hypothetical protein
VGSQSQELILVWADLWWPAILGMWRMVWCGLLQECMARIEIISEGGCGRV